MNSRKLSLWLAASGVGVALFFLAAAPHQFPIDDAYIHFIYADNLAKTGQLVFNRGEFHGIGSTSILWVLLLAALDKIGISPLISAKFLGVICLVVAALSAYEVLQTFFPRVLQAEAPRSGASDRLANSTLPPFFAALAFMVSGNVVWFSLSGMETMLFLSLGLLAIALYLNGRFVRMTLVLALMTLCRTEGVALAIVIAVLEMVKSQRIGEGERSTWLYGWLRRHQPSAADIWDHMLRRRVARRRDTTAASRARRRLTTSVLLYGLLIAPWFLYLFAATGHALPTSFSGKKLSQMVALDHFLRANPRIAFLVHLKPLVYLMMWAGYVCLFVFGGVSLPGPGIPLGRTVGIDDGYQCAFLFVPLLLFVLAPLLAAGLQRTWFYLLRAVKGDLRDRAAVALFGWFLLHNLAYMALFPSMGTTTRYQAVNHLILWVVLVVGLSTIRMPRWRFRLNWVCVFLLLFQNVFYWRGVYKANVEHMIHARIAAARFIDRELPANAVIGAHDIGAVKYFCHRKVVDLGGLIDAGFVDYYERHAVDRYLLDHHVAYLAIPGKQSTERKPMYDFLQYLGLKHSSLLRLQELKSFEIDWKTWARGMRPTGNYMPSVKIYRVVPTAFVAPAHLNRSHGPVSG